MLKIKVYLRQVSRLQITCDNFLLTTANRLSSPMPLELKVRGIGNADVALETPVLKALFQVEGNIHYYGNTRLNDVVQRGEGFIQHKELIKDEIIKV